MKLKYIIDNLLKPEHDREEKYINVDVFSSLFDKYVSLDNECDLNDNDKIRCYWVGKHYNDNDWLGYRAYFFEDEFACLSYREYDGDESILGWSSLEMAKKVKEYLISIMDGFHEIETVKTLDMDEDMGRGYGISFPYQIIEKKILYRGKLWNYKFKGNRWDWKDRLGDKIILIPEDGGKNKTVKLKNVRSPWNIKDYEEAIR